MNQNDAQIQTVRPPRPAIIDQPWGSEYACCGGEAGSGNHLGACGA